MASPSLTARKQVHHWLLKELPYRYKKHPSAEMQDGIAERRQFETSHPFGGLLYKYADRASFYFNNLGGSTPDSRQLLAKHVGSVSFLLLEFRVAIGEPRIQEPSAQDKRLRLNLSKALAKIGDPAVTPSYDDLMADITTLQGETTRAAFDVGDESTWAPYVHNLGMAAHILCVELDAGHRLPVGGVPHGEGHDNLMPDISQSRGTLLQ